MAADVGFLVAADRSMNERLVTRDLLGQSSFSPTSDVTQELDLDLKVPAGWEKRLDLKSGKVYLENCSSQNSQSATKPEPLQAADTKHFTRKRPRNILEDTNLDLKLVSSKSSINNNSCTYESVCTLDKVKSALDRAKNEQLRKTFFPRSPSSSSTSTKVILKLDKDVDQKDVTTSESCREGLLSPAGCSNCLLYVMISKDNPKCPKCDSNVLLPVLKKPRIDLNLNISI
ncbi:unnamed protein product [Rhodiola kirilowii]